MSGGSPIVCSRCITNITKEQLTFPNNNYLFQLSTSNNLISSQALSLITFFLSGNSDLTLLSPKTLHQKYVCETHFEASSFTETGRVRCDAVPISFDESSLRVLVPTKTYSARNKILEGEPSTSSNACITEGSSRKNSKWLEDITNIPGGSSVFKHPELHFGPSHEVPRRDRLASCLRAKTKQLKSKRAQVTKLRRKIKVVKALSNMKDVFESVYYSSHHSKALVRMQVMHRNRGAWKKDEKDFAIALYYKSPAAYKHLRKQKIILPSVSTIRSWIGICKFKPGFNVRYFQQLKSKVETMQLDEKVCVISFDEMTLKKGLEYSKAMDLIEGFEDLGYLGRGSRIGKQALVFMARGLYSTWKQPLMYFISEFGTSHGQLTKLIMATLDEIQKIGFIPKVIVCDQGSNNRSAYRDLGVSLDRPYFYSGAKKIFAIYDVPHLFKSLRNNMLNGDYILDGGKICFSDIKRAYEIDRPAAARSLIKITEAHIHPNAFQKMSVKLAVQIFSRAMAAAMRTAICTGQLKTETAFYTSEFVMLLDKLFDCLNSRTLFNSNPYRCALSDRCSQIKSTLITGIETMKKIIKVNHKGEKSRPPCLDGMLLTMNGIMEFHEEEKMNGKEYILTSRLNQDALENFFSVIRQRGGYNRNPTVRTFRTAFRIAAINSLMKAPSTANCEPDDDTYMNMDQDLVAQANISATALCEEILPEGSSSSSTSDSTADTSSLEQCALVYFAGYLVKKCLDKFCCTQCEKLMLKSNCDKLSDESELLILYRDYERNTDSGGLKVPSDSARTICSIAMDTFQKQFSKNMHKIKLKERILNKIIQDVNFLLPDAYQINNTECGKHRQYIVELLVTTQIYKKCKWFFTSSVSESGIKPHSKLRILRNN